MTDNGHVVCTGKDEDSDGNNVYYVQYMTPAGPVMWDARLEDVPLALTQASNNIVILTSATVTSFTTHGDLVSHHKLIDGFWPDNGTTHRVWMAASAQTVYNTSKFRTVIQSVDLLMTGDINTVYQCEKVDNREKIQIGPVCGYDNSIIFIQYTRTSVSVSVLNTQTGGVTRTVTYHHGDLDRWTGVTDRMISDVCNDVSSMTVLDAHLVLVMAARR